MDEMNNLEVSKIRDGTVIDHIPQNCAQHILSILKIPDDRKEEVVVMMNARSKKMGKKDVVKIENRELKDADMGRIALVAKGATVNIIRAYKVVRKTPVSLPSTIVNVLKCDNPACITNNDVEANTEFVVERRSPLSVTCSYCRTVLTEAEIKRQLYGRS